MCSKTCRVNWRLLNEDTIMFLIGVNCAICGRNEHHHLRHPRFSEQIRVSVDSDNIECLKFQADMKSKTNQGGMKHKFLQPKLVYIYENPNSQYCPVRLYEKYVGLILTSKKYDALYIQPKLRVTLKCWYTDHPVGINYICPTVSRLCALVGRTYDNYVNQSLKAMSVTHLTNENVDTKVIKEITGHVSNVVVEGYKHLNDNQYRQASAIIQGRVPIATVSKAPVEETVPNVLAKSTVPSKVVEIKKSLTNVKSNMSDFDTDLIKLHTPLSKKVDNKHVAEEVHEISDPVEVCNLVSKMSKRKKYKCIKINVEFYNSH